MRPHRLVRPRTPPFQGGDTGSNPVGDATFSFKQRAGEFGVSFRVRGGEDYAEEVERLFNERRTIGFSWDDAGLGDLDDKTAVIIDPKDASVVAPWFDQYYPGTKARVKEIVEPDPPDPTPDPKPKPNCPISLHRQTDESGIENFLGKVQPEFRIAALTRSLASWTAASGKPTMVIVTTQY